MSPAWYGAPSIGLLDDGLSRPEPWLTYGTGVEESAPWCPDVAPQPGSYRLAAGSARLLRDLDVPNGWLLVIDDVESSYVDLDDPLHLDFEYMTWIGAVL